MSSRDKTHSSAYNKAYGCGFVLVFASEYQRVKQHMGFKGLQLSQEGSWINKNQFYMPLRVRKDGCKCSLCTIWQLLFEALCSASLFYKERKSKHGWKLPSGYKERDPKGKKHLLGYVILDLLSC